MKPSTNTVVQSLQNNYHRDVAKNATFPGRPSQALYNFLMEILYKDSAKNG